jgi:hypothetical protein
MHVTSATLRHVAKRYAVFNMLPVSRLGQMQRTRSRSTSPRPHGESEQARGRKHGVYGLQIQRTKSRSTSPNFKTDSLKTNSWNLRRDPVRACQTPSPENTRKPPPGFMRILLGSTEAPQDKKDRRGENDLEKEMRMHLHRLKIKQEKKEQARQRILAGDLGAMMAAAKVIGSQNRGKTFRYSSSDRHR